MADGTAIEWAEATWNPVVGCKLVSPGCTNCYAMRVAHRIGNSPKLHGKYAGLTQMRKAGPIWTGAVRRGEGALDQPLRWKRGRRIFVNSMSDLFYEELPDRAIDLVFAVMALASHHRFLVLTKRAQRMWDYFADLPDLCERIGWAEHQLWEALGFPKRADYQGPIHRRLPLSNVWLGVSVEDQTRANERIPLLLDTPAAVRFISAEPLLGAIDLTKIPIATADDDWEEWNVLAKPGLDWMIAGGESGPRARPMHPDWARSLRDQCQAAGVPFFFKQWGEWIDAESLRTFLIYNGDGLPVSLASAPLNYERGKLLAQICHRPYRHSADGTTLIRVGKRAAGRRLDGREHSEFPA